MHLAQPGGADRLAVARQPPSVLIGSRPPMRVAPLWISCLLLAVLAQPGLGEVHDLGAGLGVLELRDVDVVRADARLLERRRGRLGRRRDAVSTGIDGLKTSNEPKRRVLNTAERR